MDINQYFNKPVAVLGAGISGLGAAKLLEHLKVPFQVYDARAQSEFPYDSQTQFNPDPHSLVITSPAFGPDHPWVLEAKNCLVLQEIDFASLFFKGKIIAVTGTNGKSSLTQLLCDVFKLNNQTTFTAGNIGTPLSEAVLPYIDNPHATAICEVSSYQAETLIHIRPQATLFSSFGEDHLNRHKTLKNYFNAKWNLINLTAKNNSPIFLHDSILKTAQSFGCSIPKNIQIPTNSLSAPSIFFKPPQFFNYMLVSGLCDFFGVKEQFLINAANAFKPLEHRLQLVKSINNIAFYNDSKATNFEAALAALKNFDTPPIWIAGGQSKHCLIDHFIQEASPYIQHACLIGDTASDLSKALEQHNKPHSIHPTLENATQSAFTLALSSQNNPAVLLSPGFPSFDMFESYTQRGQEFTNIVNKKLTKNFFCY